jgi:hypothetical protein
VTGLLATLLVVLVLTALACAVGVGLLVAPFVIGVDMAERRGFSTARWGAADLVAVFVALGLAYSLRDSSRVLLVLPLALCWAVPGVLALLAAGQPAGGRQGAHEL